MSGKMKSAAFGLAAFACAIALLWWGAWCFHGLRGWTAAPIGFSVAAVIYGAGSLFVFAAVKASDQ